MAAKKDPLQILIRSRRFGLMLCIVGFIWGVAVINLTILGHSREPDKPEELRVSVSFSFLQSPLCVSKTMGKQISILKSAMNKK